MPAKPATQKSNEVAGLEIRIAEVKESLAGAERDVDGLTNEDRVNAMRTVDMYKERLKGYEERLAQINKQATP